jgi:hypothetical protein
MENIVYILEVNILKICQKGCFDNILLNFEHGTSMVTHTCLLVSLLNLVSLSYFVSFPVLFSNFLCPILLVFRLISLFSLSFFDSFVVFLVSSSVKLG